MSSTLRHQVGVVAIGRNEGERLVRCLHSVKRDVDAIVYVDSGSSDASVDVAREIGAEVVMLDLSQPFTAARSRNAGIARLRELHPELEFVQVVDGDCELAPGWLEAAYSFLQEHPQIAIVCGRRRERAPHESVYNKLCDMEWDTPIGNAEACGGDALIRLNALSQVGGYNPDLIAGEEPEMCFRIRAAGRQVHRIDREMTLHDANMKRFSQSWRRSVRAGHAYAECRALHAANPGSFCVKEVRSTLEWGLLLPLVALSLAWLTWGMSLLLFAAYIWLWYRVRGHRLRHGDNSADASLYASHCVIGKFAQMTGVAMYWWNRLRGRRTRLIEYKRPDEHQANAFSSPTETYGSTSQPLRVAYLTTAYPKVSHTFIRREILELERRGHSVLRLAIRDGGDAVDPADIQEARRTFHCLAQPKSHLLMASLQAAIFNPVRALRALRTTLRMHRRSERGLVVHLAYLIEAALLCRVVRQARIEHLHVHFGTNCAAVARLMRILGGPPFSIAIHGPDEFDAPYGLSLKEKIEEASFVTAISEYCAAQLRRWVPFSHWHKIHIVRCTVGNDFFDARTPIDQATQTLVCVGRLTAQKAQHLLIEAMHTMRQTHPAVRLILAGDGEMRPELEAHIQRLNLGERISITGWIDEQTVRDLVLQSRCLVQPSFAEGLPVVIMEALALGRTVISTAIAGIPELVRTGETGWLVPAGSLDELVRAMQAALETPVHDLNRMGKAGRELVLQRHSTTTETSKLEQLLHEHIRSRSLVEPHRAAVRNATPSCSSDRSRTSSRVAARHENETDALLSHSAIQGQGS